MIWRKALAILFAMLIVSTTAAFGGVRADTQVRVILVSDNEADSALAEYLANVTEAIVVTTSWGVYDPNVTAEITAYAPDEVIIIGGPDAVVEQYVEDLMALNITVERWGGANRYETNLAVLGNATLKLRIKFENSVVIVPGHDPVAIKEALRRAVKVHGIIIFANNTTDPVRIMMKLQVRPKNMTIIRSHIMKHVGERVRERVEGNVTEIDVNITEEMALQAINASEERIKTAEELLANVTLPEQKKWLAEKMLNLSKMELEKAKEAYEEGKYGKAYGQAIAAKSHAEFVIKIASKEWEFKVKSNMKLGLEIRLTILEKQVEILEKAGINVSQVKSIIEAAKEAIEQGDLDSASTLIMKAQMLLRELYIGEKIKIRRAVHVPFHGHRKP